ncbi:MAG: GNAT family N-acetyltransferase, partial [Rothia sp. (in: high G+C Gram-positive bacteria)]|nr:GNAT family N-acetyltransferase [Rothia sp. (in: high G+C Gram-positive bacteria)]
DKVFAGELGDFYPEASPVVVDDNDRVIAAVLCLKNRKDGVEPADLPTIYELVTAASRRREGIAEQLIRQTIHSMNQDGIEQVSVRIPETNAPALALYLTLDFHRWAPNNEDLY